MTYSFLPDTPTVASGFPGGWVDLPDEVEAIEATTPRFAEAAAPIQGTGKGKVVLLWNAVRSVRGHDYVLKQTIGDCVSQGAAGAVDYLKCLEIVAGEAEDYTGDTATEFIYAASRVEVGGGRISGDGSTGAWGARAVSEYGTLVRKDYGGGIDLSVYSGQRARTWGAPGRGAPDALEAIAREHVVGSVARVRTYADAIDALANGYPITIASDRGFTTTRDAQGFLKPSSVWSHQMMCCGFDDASGRPGVCIQNSWGPDRAQGGWVSGPRRHEQPPGSFWCDAEVFERDMLRAGEGWAFSRFVGFPKAAVDYSFI